MEKLINSRLQEIGQCLQNDDTNRASRRLLDFTKDFCQDKTLQSKALDLRRKYNQAKELGTNSINNSQLIVEMMAFYSDEICSANFTLPEQSGQGKLLAQAHGITKKYNSRLHNFHLEPIDIDLKAGEITGLVGENGNGKTTLLRMLSGNLQTNGGSFTFYTDELASDKWEEIRPHIAFIPQRIKKWYGTAEENLSFEAAIKGVAPDKNEKQVDFIIQRLGLSNFRELHWNQLSGGYKLRFEIAKALVWEPRLLILDEPLANLDMQAQELLLQDLRNMADSIKNPVSIILSSQQLHEVEAIADKVIFLKNGRAVHNGSLSSLTDDSAERTIEIAGDFEHSDLQAALNGWEGLKIEKSASSYTVIFKSEYSLNDFLAKMISANINLDYYRDISNSTKKLFNDKY